MNVALFTQQSRAGYPRTGLGALPLDLEQRRRRAPKWHLIYYILALFDLATVSGSLYLTYSIMSIYTNSVEANQGWANHLASLTELGQKASAVNAPGNDIFDSHDVPREKERQQAALEKYGQQFEHLKTRILRDVEPARAEELRKRLDDIEVAMNDMLSETDLIFSYFSNNQAESAARHMASMDRKLANLSAVIAAASQSVRTIQSGLFKEQVAEAAYLRRYEYLFGGMILLMVGCVTVYGHKIAHEFKRREAERERYLEAMRAEEAKKLELERKLRQSQKMDALGTMAGGMAHEFNNILTPMIGLTTLTMRTLPPDSLGHSNLRKVTESGERAKKLIAQVLNFSHDQPRELDTIRVGSVIREALGILRSTIPLTITLRHQISATRDLVRADPVELHQVLMNLVGNAVYAMKGRTGAIDVTLETVAVTGGEARELRVAPGDYVRLGVADTGNGMDGETLERIFDPFFTTKGVGEGTGLGLSVVHGIVEGHGGAIKVASRVNEGTRFDLWFPVAAVDGVAGGDKAEPGARTPGGARAGGRLRAGLPRRKLPRARYL